MESEPRARIMRMGIIILVVALIFTALVPLSAVATSISMFPSPAAVGQTVTVIGKIDTAGGRFGVLFDGALVAFGKAPVGQFGVQKDFAVPEATGTDAGQAHTVTLRDNATGGSANTALKVITSRSISLDATRVQEGLSTTITVKVAGGIATTQYTFNVNVLDPSSASHLGSASLTTDAKGSGSGSVAYPAGFPAKSGANTNFVGVYVASATEASPGTLPVPGQPSFSAALTDATSYERFERANIRSTGWKSGEEVFLDIALAATGKSATIGAVAYPIRLRADASGLVSHTTAMLPVDFNLGTHNVTVANSTGGFNPTVKDPSDFQQFEATPSTKIAVTVAAQPAASLQRTLTALAKLSINYPDGTFFTAAALGSGSISVSVVNKTGPDQASVATVTLTAIPSIFDANTKLWNVSFRIPPFLQLEAHNFRLLAGAVIDINGNSGPVAAVNSAQFVVQRAVLSVTITQQWGDSANFFTGRPVIMRFKVAYPDNSPLTPTLVGSAGSVAVNVSFAGAAFDVVNLTLNQGVTFAAGIWTAQWTIPSPDTLPPGAALTTGAGSQYRFIIRAGMVSDAFGNSNIADALSNRFNLLAAVVFEVPPVKVDVNVGSLHFPGEMAEFTVLTTVGGQPLTMDSISARLRLPDGTSQTLPADRVDVGVYRVRFSIPTSAAPGVYALEVLASVFLPNLAATSRGAALMSFQISPGLSGLVATITQIQGDIATIKTDVGTIRVSLSAINAHLTSIDGNVATIQTDIGTLKTDVSTINAKVTDISNGVATIKTDVGTVKADLAALDPKITSISNGVATLQTSVGTVQADVSAIRPMVTRIDGNVATVQTDVGTLKGTVSSISGDVATIKTGVGDLQARLPSNVATTSTVSNVLNLLYVVTALALVAALGAIAAVAVISRRLTK